MENWAMMTFRGVDLILEHSVDTEKLRQALQSVFAVPAECISIINDITQYPKQEDAQIVCVMTPVAGDFTLLLSIQANLVLKGSEDMLALVQLICNDLGCRCLTPDEGPDPYTVWVITPYAPPQRAQLDVMQLDQNRHVLEQPNKSGLLPS
jgi:hypothetical protein